MSSIRSRSLSGVSTLIVFMCLFPVQGQTQSFVTLRPSSSAKPWLREPSATPGPRLIQPDELMGILKSTRARKPLIIQVGFRVLYLQAHIPGSEYLGPASRPEGIQKLRKRLESLRRTRSIVIYCGCCPWRNCPNVNPAYKELRSMGFKNVKVLYIAQNFGSDWVDKGYPVARGK